MCSNLKCFRLMLLVSEVSLPADKHQLFFLKKKKQKTKKHHNFTNHPLGGLKAILVSSFFSNFSFIDISTGEGSS